LWYLKLTNNNCLVEKEELGPGNSKEGMRIKRKIGKAVRKDRERIAEGIYLDTK
jgi:hypothetical protein